MDSGWSSSKKADQAPAVSAAKKQESQFEVFHAGPWEESIGYAQAIRAGHSLHVSGTVGANAKGQPEDLDSQMKVAYDGIGKTLARYNTDFSHVVMERIYTTDIEALIRSQQTRKKIYGDWAPAATWVEVKRLYSAGDKIEIEVEVALD
ncbi:MAG TPA: Rid family hydrolase [Candidatus Acidoferrum sp.]|nr:Rid family hydrolase [Candidatus Acidoferrum sp.]